MSPTDLAELLKLPAVDRAGLAITLWESLTDEERGAELKLGPEERAELDRRSELSDHVVMGGAAGNPLARERPPSRSAGAPTDILMRELPLVDHGPP